MFCEAFMYLTVVRSFTVTNSYPLKVHHYINSFQLQHKRYILIFLSTLQITWNMFIRHRLIPTYSTNNILQRTYRVPPVLFRQCTQLWRQRNVC